MVFVERNWMNEQCKYKVFWQAVVVNFNFMYFVPINRFFVDYLQILHKISQYSSVWVFCSESALSAFFINQFRFLIKNYLVNKFLQYTYTRKIQNASTPFFNIGYRRFCLQIYCKWMKHSELGCFRIFIAILFFLLFLS